MIDLTFIPSGKLKYLTGVAPAKLIASRHDRLINAGRMDSIQHKGCRINWTLTQINSFISITIRY